MVIGPQLQKQPNQILVFLEGFYSASLRDGQLKGMIDVNFSKLSVPVKHRSNLKNALLNQSYMSV